VTGFKGESVSIPDDVAARMRGVSWHAQLAGGFIGPSLAELRLLHVSHWDFAGSSRMGQLVVAEQAAAAMLRVFAEIYRAEFPIEKMRLIDEYAASDERSMADNNSSAYNCRLIAGTARPSQHARGLAVDINPVQNPYVSRGGQVQPTAAEPYLDRSQRRAGMLFDDGPVVAAFASIGWIWGGHWQPHHDYHHFECHQFEQR
jgi:D-alanyl-D-alanine carboxypeptidase